MVHPIPQNGREKEEGDSHHWNPSDADVTPTSNKIPTFPAGFPLNTDDNEAMFPTVPFPTDSSFPTEYPPWTRWPPEGGFVTSTVTSSPAALSENMGSTTRIFTEEVSVPTSTNVDGYGGGYPGDFGRKQSSNHGVPKAAVGIVPVLMLVIIGLIIFFCLRKRKQQRQQQASAQAQIQEMKMRAQPSVQPYMAPPTQPQYTAPPSHPPSASPAIPQPVILGPIVPGFNGAYFTGIDTSDIVSMNNDRTGLGNPFADGDSLHEEPPPPYRPRSIAPLSRDTSLRAPPAVSSRTNLIGGHQSPRSPFETFADHQNDDAVSDMSGPTLRRNHDGMSVVSDLSYQEDPVVARPTV